MNTHRQRLRNLLVGEGRPVPPELDNTSVSFLDVSALHNSPPRLSPSSQPEQSPAPSHKRPCRRFLPRHQYTRKAQKSVRTPPKPLVTNFSDFPLEGTFVPTPKTVNTTQIEANIQRFNRSVRWAEYFSHISTDDDSNSPLTPSGPKQIFRKIKHNLPKSPPPRALQSFLDSVHDDILYSPLNKISPNLTK